MQILMVTEDLAGAQIGGLGKPVVALSNAMPELGHEVAILGRADRAHTASAAATGFDGRLIPGFAFSRPGWKETQRGFVNPVKRPWFARKIARAIARHAAGYDAVHYHGHLPMVGRCLDVGKGFGEFLAQLESWLPAPAPAQVTVIGDGPLALARGGTPGLAADLYYDGQLRLADDMPQLVAILVGQLARAPRTVPLPASFALDVFQAIPDILDVHAE